MVSYFQIQYHINLLAPTLDIWTGLDCHNKYNNQCNKTLPHLHSSVVGKTGHAFDNAYKIMLISRQNIMKQAAIPH